MEAPEQILVAIAAGFEAESVVRLVRRGREAGIRLWLVGLSSLPVRSGHGLQWLADRTPDEVRQLSRTDLYFPGPRAAAASLLRDPRVHRLARRVSEAGGCLVTDPAALDVFQPHGLSVVGWPDYAHAEALGLGESN